MESNRPYKPVTAFEYFLYAAILAETALAALIYKGIFRAGELTQLRVYFAIFYFGFMGWIIAQLNRLHRKRQSLTQDSAPGEQQPPEAAQNRPLLGLTASQVMTVLLVFATAVAVFTWLLRELN